MEWRTSPWWDILRACADEQVPMQRKLVDIELMSQQERDWLSAFQAEVKEKVTPILKEYQDERALKWLEKECAAA